MSGCSSAATTSFSNLLSSSSATKRAPNFLCSALETQTGVSRFIGCSGGDFASSCRYLSPLVCVQRSLVRSLPSSLTQPSQIELEPIIEGRSPLSDEDNLRTIRIKIQLRKECLFGEKFFIVGAQPDLGLWNPLDAVPMTWSDNHLWTAELDIPLGEPVQFKLILREISGKFLWQPGEDRVLHTWETCNVISVIEDWEDEEAQQVSEERVVNNECEESDLMETKVKQLQHSDKKYNDEETYESSEFSDSFVCSSHEIVATAANNTSHHSYTEMEICGNQVKDDNVTLHADKDEDEEQVKVDHDASNIVSEKSADTHTLVEQVKEHRELEKVNGRSVTFNEEHQNEIAAPNNDEDANRRPDQDLDSVFSELPSNKEQVKEHWELEKVNGRSVAFNEEHQNEIAAPNNDEDANHLPDQDLDSVFSELPSNKEQVKEHWELEKVNGRSVAFNEEHQNEIAAPNNDEDANHLPDQDLDSVFSELPSNKESDPWSDEIKWGQKTLKRFLNNFGFI